MWERPSLKRGWATRATRGGHARPEELEANEVLGMVISGCGGFDNVGVI